MSLWWWITDAPLMRINKSDDPGINYNLFSMFDHWDKSTLRRYNASSAFMPPWLRNPVWINDTKGHYYLVLLILVVANPRHQ